MDILRGDDHLFSVHLKGGVYQLFPQTLKTDTNKVSLEDNFVKKESKIQLGHCRSGHIRRAILVHTCQENGVPD